MHLLSPDFHNYLYDFYYGNGVVPSFRDRFAFDEEKTEKIPLDDSNIEYTVVRMMSVEESEKMFEDLMAQPEAFSRQDEADLQWYFEKCAGRNGLLSDAERHLRHPHARRYRRR